MRKIGFTLIELLAVLVILVIIMAIATPIILGIIDDARDSANMNEANMVLDSMELLYAKATLNEDISKNFNGVTDVYDLIEMDSNKPETGTALITKEGEFGLALWIDGKCYKKMTTANKITVDEEIKLEEDCNLELPIYELVHSSTFRSIAEPGGYKSTLTKIIFSSEITEEYYAAENKLDFSKNQGSNEVVGYIDTSNGQKILHVQANGLIKINNINATNNGHMFANLYALEALETNGAIETSHISNWAYGFYGCETIEILDLSDFSFDSFKPTDYYYTKDLFGSTDSLKQIIVDSTETMEKIRASAANYDIRNIEIVVKN